MADVIDLKEFRARKYGLQSIDLWAIHKELEFNTSITETRISFIEAMQKNKEKSERLKQIRKERNQKALTSYRLKK